MARAEASTPKAWKQYEVKVEALDGPADLREKPQPGEKAALRREARDMLGEVKKLEALAIERILDDAKIICATLTGLDSQFLGQRRFTVAGHLRSIALQLEVHRQPLGDRRVVLDDDDQGGRGRVGHAASRKRRGSVIRKLAP